MQAPSAASHSLLPFLLLQPHSVPQPRDALPCFWDFTHGTPHAWWLFPSIFNFFAPLQISASMSYPQWRKGKGGSWTLLPSSVLPEYQVSLVSDWLPCQSVNFARAGLWYLRMTPCWGSPVLSKDPGTSQAGWLNELNGLHFLPMVAMRVKMANPWFSKVIVVMTR